MFQLDCNAEHFCHRPMKSGPVVGGAPIPIEVLAGIPIQGASAQRDL